jgi:hypothetical protein
MTMHVARRRVNVDQETGDVLQDQRTISYADGGVIAVTTTYGAR